MTKHDIKKALEDTLLNAGKMEADLYEYELEEMVEELKESLLADKDDYIFALTVHKNDITLKHDTAMILIEQSGELHINEAARDKLKEVWQKAYTLNMKNLIPTFTRQLAKDEIPINGIKTVL